MVLIDVGVDTLLSIKRASVLWNMRKLSDYKNIVAILEK